MRVGNILPGERISVELTLVNSLTYEDGEATFRFPLVVAPRYIPGRALEDVAVGDGHAHDTDAVPDASRITPPVLLPGFPHPVRLTIDVGIDPAGLALSGVRSSLHAVSTDDGRLRIQPGERANRDFVLRLRYGADRVDRFACAGAGFGRLDSFGGNLPTHRVAVGVNRAAAPPGSGACARPLPAA